MTSPSVVPETPTAASRRTQPITSRVIAWLLLLGWATVAATWLLAPAPADWSDFEEAATAGEVRSIQVSGHAHAEPVAQGQRYRTVVEVTWKERWRTYTTTVVQASRHGNAPPIPLAGDSEMSIWGTADQEPTARMLSVHTQLERLAPDTPVTDHVNTNYGVALGRHIPWWAGLIGLVVVIGSFAHLLLLPHPQRATRWAWFWLWCIPGLGTPLFLLGSGATLDRRPTDERIRGLTGFVILLVAGTFASTLLSA